MSVPRHTAFDFSPSCLPVSKLNICRLRGAITYKISDVNGPSYVSWYIGGTKRQVDSLKTAYNREDCCLTIIGGFWFTPRPKVEKIEGPGANVIDGERFRIHLTIGTGVQLNGA